MLNSLLASLLLAVSALSNALLGFGGQPATAVRWDGPTDIRMLDQVRQDIAAAKAAGLKKLEVKILSPGGPVITSLEIARLVRQASNEGLVVEIHAEALCASGCTFVLASGTPGHRFITRNALYLVHPIQSGGSCVDRKGEHGDDYDPDAAPATGGPAKRPTEQDKVLNALYDAMVNQYVEYTGHSRETIESWFVCGRSQAGLGALAVQLNLADQVRG